MRSFITWLLLLMSISLFAQKLDQIKHIEIVSEIQDSMALINKEDIEKINKTFYEKRQLDSLTFINDSIILHLSQLNEKLDSVALSQLKVIQNDKIIIKQLKSDTTELRRKLTRAHKIIFWESTTGAIVILILCLLI